MTNEEFFNKKIDEEYKNYLKRLNIPTKEEWLKMNHKEEIYHKFNVGDIIRENGGYNHYVIIDILLKDGMYQLKSGDTGLIYCKDIDFIDSFCSFVI